MKKSRKIGVESLLSWDDLSLEERERLKAELHEEECRAAAMAALREKRSSRSTDKLKK
jgi:hypothetical protein